MIQFTLQDIPPSVNDYWRHDRGRTHISEEGKAWRDYVDLELCGMDAFAKKLPLFCDIALYFSDNRRDPDNCIKSLQDSLQHAGLVPNDRQIEDVRAWKAGIDRENPRTMVTIGALNERHDFIKACFMRKRI